MRTVLLDLKYGVRHLAKSPGVTAVIILALALGIGVNTTIFSVVNHVLISPIPYEEPEQLVTLWQMDLRNRAMDRVSVSYPNFLDWQERNRVFQQVGAVLSRNYNLTGEGEPERLQGAAVSASQFPMLRVQPVLGRTFSPEEDQPGGNAVVVLSHELWQRRFNADPQIIGKPMNLDGTLFTIVGVMPPKFAYPGRSELWTSLSLTAQSQRNNRDTTFLRVVARLKPGVTPAQAQADMDSVAADISRQVSDSEPVWGVNLITFYDLIVGGIRSALLLIQCAVGFVLLIACANVATLLLARASARQKEIAVRTAFGAKRRRIIRQLLTEDLLLMLAGGGLGLLLTSLSNRLIVALNPLYLIPRAGDLRLDGRVLAFTIIISLLATLLFGLVPALYTSNVDLNGALKETSRGAAGGRRRNRFRNMLVVSEVALTLVLLVGAGLMIRTFLQLQRVDPGFNAKNLLTMQVSLSPARYGEKVRQAEFFQRAFERIESLPEVTAASAVSHLPFSGSSLGRSFTIEGRAPRPGESLSAGYRLVRHNYLQTMGIPVRAGRAFSDQDREGTTPVVVVNQMFADKYFPDQSPIGQHIKVGKDTYTREVAGVVGNVRHTGLTQEVSPEIYVPFVQEPDSSMSLLMRTAGEPDRVANAVRGVILSLDGQQPVSNVQSMEQLISNSIAPTKLYSLMMGIMGGVALLLALIGIYSIVSYSVAQRTHEIGVRMALGAKPFDVLKLLVGQGMSLVVSGIVVGLLLALILTRVMASLLFGITATDPMTFLGVALFLAGVAFLACYVPGRQATKVDPVIAIKYE